MNEIEVVVSERKVWFPEPKVDDPTWAEERESTSSWLERSTVERAVLARAFMNMNLNELPVEVAEQLSSRLRHHWKSTFFEMIVARTLQVLGANLRAEVATSSGRRPDFLASFGQTKVAVEAVVPVVSEAHEEYRSVMPVLKEIVAGWVPEHLSLHLQELPSLRPDESKKALRRAVTKMLPLDSIEDEPLELSSEVGGRPLSFLVFNRKPGWRPIMSGPGLVYLRDSVTPLKKTFQRKRAQLREAGEIRLIAVSGSDECDLDDLDVALFGMTLQTVCGDTEFQADGEFFRGVSDAPTVSGVLFFQSSSFFCKHEPTLFLHPKADLGSFPAALRDLEIRALSEDKIVTVPSRLEGGVMPHLQPVPSNPKLHRTASALRAPAAR